MEKNYFEPRFTEYFAAKRLDWEPKKPYHETNHSHCWDQDGEPACGIKEHGGICCLCGKLDPEYTCKESP